MTVPRDSESGRWVDGTLESGADDATRDTGQAPPGEAPDDGGGDDPADEKGVGLGMGAPNSFEPEEDPGP